MAQTFAVFMKAAGTDIEGYSSQTKAGGLDWGGSIEGYYFEDSVRTAREAGTGMATGRRTYEPIIFRKRIDKASPLIAKALCNNEVVECSFKFLRPNQEGDGTTEHFFTTEIAEARVAYIKRVSPDSIDPASSKQQMEEEVGIVFHTITWIYEDGGITHTDNWREQA